MSTQDEDISDIFDNMFEETSKPFSQVFKIEPSELGLQITAFQKTKVGNVELYPGKSIITGSITLDNKPITDFLNKNLTGRTHKYSKVFEITGFADTSQ